jgi:hypothetical protein
VVVDDPAEAIRLVALGQCVVLVVESPPVPIVEGPGRLAILVGPLDQPATWAAAREMAAELFGV